MPCTCCVMLRKRACSSQKTCVFVCALCITMSAAGLQQQQEGRGTIQLLQHLAESDFEDVNRGLLHPDGYLCENMSLINT